MRSSRSGAVHSTSPLPCSGWGSRAGVSSPVARSRCEATCQPKQQTTRRSRLRSASVSCCPAWPELSSSITPSICAADTAACSERVSWQSSGAERRAFLGGASARFSGLTCSVRAATAPLCSSRTLYLPRSPSYSSTRPSRPLNSGLDFRFCTSTAAPRGRGPAGVPAVPAGALAGAAPAAPAGSVAGAVGCCAVAVAAAGGCGCGVGAAVCGARTGLRRRDRVTARPTQKTPKATASCRRTRCSSIVAVLASRERALLAMFKNSSSLVLHDAAGS
eukprot:scaffold87447_cov67-Phaeocystis_antarctica.AAC.2